MKQLVFTGQFRDLKKYGFHHNYMYANNYRCWTSYEVGNLRDTWIWMSQRRVEIGHFLSRTYVFFEYVRTHDRLPELGFLLDLVENKLVPETDERFVTQAWHEVERVTGLKYWDVTADKIDSICCDWWARYRYITVDQPTFDEIKQLWKDNLLEIKEIEPCS